MRYMKITRIAVLALLLAVAGAAAASIATARADDNNRAPDLPSPLCDRVQVPEGNKAAFHAYALGVQIYRWNGAAWAFVEPVATLFADAGYHSKVGIHYAGPTWESNSGSKVQAMRLDSCTPDSNAIPWLLLQAVSNEGPGIFGSATYVQRLNTTGGVAPAAPGRSIGAVVEVPYTAEYLFYRAHD